MNAGYGKSPAYKDAAHQAIPDEDDYILPGQVDEHQQHHPIQPGKLSQRLMNLSHQGRNPSGSPSSTLSRLPTYSRTGSRYGTKDLQPSPANASRKGTQE